MMSSQAGAGASGAGAGAGPCHSRTLSTTLIDESVAAAAEVVQKWHPDEKPNVFLHSGDHDEELSQFLGAIADLHRAMLFFASHSDDANNSGLIVQAQELHETAMSRLDMELRRLLLHDDDQIQGQSQAAIRITIKRIVGAMMGAGYGKECLSTFKSSRRAMMAGKLQPLLVLVAGPGQQGASNSYYSIIKNMMNKLGWDQVDPKIIQPWLAVASMAFRSLFPREKELCEAVFDDAGHGVGEAVLAAIVEDHATRLLAVAEAAVARARRAPERLFRVLDIHHTLVQLQISNDHEQLGPVVAKAAEAARATLLSLEAAILHSNNKASSRIPVHPLTRYVMNYLVFLADYDQLEEETMMIHRLVSALLSKLDSKAGSYRREAALSYLFLANNTHYVATKVQRSSKLQSILGEAWAEAHMAKARGHAQVYTRAVWGKVISFSSTSTSTTATATTAGGVLPGLVMEAIQVQDQWMAADDDMAKALRLAATAAVVPKYRMFYRRYGAAMSLTPGDVTTMIATLFTNVPASQPQDPNAK